MKQGRTERATGATLHIILHISQAQQQHQQQLQQQQQRQQLQSDRQRDCASAVASRGCAHCCTMSTPLRLSLSPVVVVMSWMCLLDQFDVSATITGVRWRYCAVENLLGLWSSLFLVFVTEYYTSTSYNSCARNRSKPRRSRRPLVWCGTWSLGHAWHTDQGIDHRCFRPHLEQRVVASLRCRRMLRISPTG